MDQSNGVNDPIAPGALNRLSVSGYKSISTEQTIEIRDLTILAGANSSGKSSMMQPLLLMKQTIECAYDPGPLLLNGPHVRFSKVDQLLSRIGDRASFTVGIEASPNSSLRTTFRKQHENGFFIEQATVPWGDKTAAFHHAMTSSEIRKAVAAQKQWHEKVPTSRPDLAPWQVGSNRCFLTLRLKPDTAYSLSTPFWGGTIDGGVANTILATVHVPGIRGNAERDYPVTEFGSLFQGPFDKYTATILTRWAEEKQERRLAKLAKDLQQLGLTGGIRATQLHAARIQIEVGRTPDAAPDRPENTVNIADAGFGLSYVLPVLVALHVADPGQLVYIEQPEVHLHPRAQVTLAQMLAAAANRGVRVVIETHSSLLLLGVQAAVAEGKLTADKVKLHWFERGKTGRTRVRSGELDEAGRFGDWPADFDDVQLYTQKEYLDAASKRLFAQ